MRSIARALVLLAAIGTLTLAQEAPDPFLAERILPQNALVYLSMPRNSLKSPEHAASKLAKMINHPEIKSFIDSFQKWFEKRKTQRVGDQPSMNEQVKAATGLTLDEIEAIYREGAISVALDNDPRGSEWPNYSRDWRAAEEGAKWGAAIGAVAGFIFPTERWRRVRLRP